MLCCGCRNCTQAIWSFVITKEPVQTRGIQLDKGAGNNKRLSSHHAIVIACQASQLRRVIDESTQNVKLPCYNTHFWMPAVWLRLNFCLDAAVGWVLHQQRCHPTMHAVYLFQARHCLVRPKVLQEGRQNNERSRFEFWVRLWDYQTWSMA